jgi:hypothetical protein
MKSLDAGRWRAFKSDHLLRAYERIFADVADRPGVALLELGVYKGGSLAMWHDYFEHATIVGLDTREPQIVPLPDGVRFYRGSQSDTQLLTRLALENAPDGFDIVIDDCSHIGEWTRASFWHLFEHHLKPGGIYVIEDWGTGFMRNWPDGRALPSNFRRRRSIRSGAGAALDRLTAAEAARRYLDTHPGWTRLARKLFTGQRFRSHSYGMVGFVKQLLDEFGAMRTRPGDGTWIERLEVLPSQVFVFKNTRPPAA